MAGGIAHDFATSAARTRAEPGQHGAGRCGRRDAAPGLAFAPCSPARKEARFGARAKSGERIAFLGTRLGVVPGSGDLCRGDATSPAGAEFVLRERSPVGHDHDHPRRRRGWALSLCVRTRAAGFRRGPPTLRAVLQHPFTGRTRRGWPSHRAGPRGHRGRTSTFSSSCRRGAPIERGRCRRRLNVLLIGGHAGILASRLRAGGFRSSTPHADEAPGRGPRECGGILDRLDGDAGPSASGSGAAGSDPFSPSTRTRCPMNRCTTASRWP